MKVSASGGGKDFGRLEEGVFMSRIVHVIGLGRHMRDDRYPEKGECDKVLLTLEYPTETITIDGEEKPRFQSKQENMFLNEKSNLYKLIKAADPKADLGKEYDLSSLLGKPLMTTIGSTSGGKAKITGFSGVVKGMNVPDAMSEMLLYDFYAPDTVIFEKLMPWVKEVVTSAVNYSGAALPSTDEPGPDMDDDDEAIPF